MLREVGKWPEDMPCGDLAPSYQYGGFTYHWDKLAAAPDALASCAKLGAAIREAGGLFGGDSANCPLARGSRGAPRRAASVAAARTHSPGSARMRARRGA